MKNIIRLTPQTVDYKVNIRVDKIGNAYFYSIIYKTHDCITLFTFYEIHKILPN